MTHAWSRQFLSHRIAIHRLPPQRQPSLGPIKAGGKAIASANSITHGLSSRLVLLPSESAEDYQAVVSAWTETLKPGSPGEAKVVARVADLNFRLAGRAPRAPRAGCSCRCGRRRPTRRRSRDEGLGR